MLEVAMNYPLIVLVVVVVLFWLVKNHILASHDEVKDSKDEIIKSLIKSKTFVTPEELNTREEKIRNDVKAEFLSLAVFNEFKSGIDKQFVRVNERFDEGRDSFKELFKGIDDIKNYLLEMKK